jgi:uncharacterized RDD family membrane protein YckC
LNTHAMAHEAVSDQIGDDRAATARYGGFWSRVFAAVIDALLVGIPLSILLAASGLNGSHSDGAAGTVHFHGRAAFLARILVPWLYFALMESSSRQATVGKMALRLRVTDAAGGRIGFLRASARYFAKYLSAVFAIGFILVAFTARKRGLHDMIAGTLVEQR